MSRFHCGQFDSSGKYEDNDDDDVKYCIRAMDKYYANNRPGLCFIRFLEQKKNQL